MECTETANETLLLLIMFFQRYRKIASLKSKGLDKCFFALKIMILGDAFILGAYHSFKWPLPNSEEYAMNNRLPIKIQ